VQVKRALVLARLRLVQAVFFLARRLPSRRRVVLATAHGKDISGNLAFIRAELARRPTPVPVSVLAYRPATSLGGHVAAAVHAVQAAFHLATARVFIVDDYFFPIYAIRPRPGTTIVQVWHACGAFKKFGHSVADKSFGAERVLTDRVRIHSNYDVCLVSSASVIPHYAEAFGQPASTFRSDLGIPRTDLFFGERATTAAESVRRRYAIPADRRVILYAPTFRGDRVTDARHPVDLDLRRLHAVLGDDHVVLQKLHPFVRTGASIDADLRGFVIDASDHPDVNELMLVSDVLVTDYSSVIFEFALLGRPMVFFAPDREAYERERGFYADYRTFVPGPIFETSDEVATYIRTAEFDLDRVARFRHASFDVADGRATARVVDELVLPALRPTSGGRD
jgi:CDP-glycerol glycerophosphotransferase (TagB/SpsB family)